MRVGHASGSAASSWVTTSCSMLEKDASYRKLPHEGQLYRLGGVSFEGQGNDSLQFLVISGEGKSSWDMLWSDYSGAFDMEKSSNTTLFIPWRAPHSPFFLVSYQSVNIHVARAKKRDSGLLVSHNVTCGAHLRRATQLASEMVLDDRNHLRQIDRETGVRIEVLDNEEVFRYPVRQPFFRKRSNSSGLVTACTQLTVDRLQRLESMAQMYAGPVSAVVYVGFRGQAAAELEQVNRFWNSSVVLTEFVDLHLVFDENKPWYATGLTNESHGLNPYPVNFLRQYAIEQAMTDWVLYLEADMATVPNAHNIIVERWDDMMAVNEKSNEAVFVVPIYHSRSTNSSEMMEQIPSNKSELKLMLKPDYPKPLKRMGKRYRSHSALNYDKWESVADGVFIPYDESGNPRAILEKRQEPYFIIRKKAMPPYNVLFAGMGQDKETHTRDISACGFVFYLHPYLFAVDFEQRLDIGGWTNPPRKGNAGWRQIFAHSMHEAYKQEIHKGRAMNVGTFSCCNEGLHESSARIRGVKVPPIPNSSI